jgi:MoaA/NifB/PqqE/SkfB family radical SAM enzyme
MLFVTQNHVLQHAFCPFPFNTLILDSQGHTYMCCNQSVSLGDINNDILDIWRGSLAGDIRAVTRKGWLHPACSATKTCPFYLYDKPLMEFAMHANAAYPLHLHICLPNVHCNISPPCIMCRRNFVDNHEPYLIDQLCDKAMPIMPYLMSLRIDGTAEPFWKHIIFDILSKVHYEQNRHVEIRASTNGTCVDPTTSQIFFERVDHSDVFWSLDAATPDTYKKIRSLDIFDQVIDNLRYYNRTRDRDKHKLTIYNNINTLNVGEMVQMLEQAKEVGADGIVFIPTTCYSGIGKLPILLSKNGFVLKTIRRVISRAKEMQFPVEIASTFYARHVLQ